MSDIAAELNQPEAEYQSVSPPVSKLATLIRTLCIREYRAWQFQTKGMRSNYGERPIPSWDGGETPSGRRVKKAIWPSIAKHVVSGKLNPYTLIPLVFSTWEGGKPPIPPWLVSDNLSAKYAQHTAEQVHQLQVELSVQRQLTKREVFQLQSAEVDPLDLSSAMYRTLINTQMELTPLFRVCAAAQVDYPEWTTHFEDAATWQYLFDRDAYDAAWQDFIPAAFKNIADNLDAALRAS